eukprot:snap_masked-scaffold_1-processed-gene-30.24-mRNA-1 protein AED:1.00 eAED:1.00 QI:0/0/0/0/1/1/2/0/102
MNLKEPENSEILWCLLQTLRHTEVTVSFRARSKALWSENCGDVSRFFAANWKYFLKKRCSLTKLINTFRALGLIFFVFISLCSVALISRNHSFLGYKVRIIA